MSGQWSTSPKTTQMKNQRFSKKILAETLITIVTKTIGIIPTQPATTVFFFQYDITLMKYRNTICAIYTIYTIYIPVYQNTTYANQKSCPLTKIPCVPMLETCCNKNNIIYHIDSSEQRRNVDNQTGLHQN